jgi:hypothetical protein
MRTSDTRFRAHTEITGRRAGPAPHAWKLAHHQVALPAQGNGDGVPLWISFVAFLHVADLLCDTYHCGQPFALTTQNSIFSH